MTRSRYKGHLIVWKNRQWVYEDNNVPVEEESRPCAHCGADILTHDACIGRIPNVKGACCGHGDPSKAYIVFKDGKRITGEKVWTYKRTS